MRQGAIPESTASSLYAKFDDDRFRNEKASVLWKSDNNKNPNNNKNNNVGSAWGPGNVSKKRKK